MNVVTITIGPRMSARQGAEGFYVYYKRSSGSPRWGIDIVGGPFPTREAALPLAEEYAKGNHLAPSLIQGRP